MSTTLKEKALSKNQRGNDLVDQLTEVRRSIEGLNRRISFDELQRLRDIVRELASHVEQVVPRDGESGRGSASTTEQAQREDVVLERELARAQVPSPQPMCTSASIRSGNAILEQAAHSAVSALEQRVARGELLSSAQLQQALGVGRQAISAAVKAGRMFAMVGTSGENLYPAYFADPSLDRRRREQVAKSLGTLPAGSKHFFFTSPSTYLQSTPLEALRKGRIDDVLSAAAGFADR